jgi:3-phosphoshikimate 1-carboxyvinyltransferase
MMNALAERPTEIHNLSTARDTRTMKKILLENPEVWDVQDAGTTMRFLTAYLALKADQKVITGSARMKERPISPLVDALRSIGASISYLEKEGFPPLSVSKITVPLASSISIPGNISSQYISALLMIAPCLPEGLRVEVTTEIYSRPYIRMTLKLMEGYGVRHRWEGNSIEIPPQTYRAHETQYIIENDWSGASYWYALVALAPPGSQLLLENLSAHSSQGDKLIASIMEKLGVRSVYNHPGVSISHSPTTVRRLHLDFKECPDLAQTVMVVAAAKGVALKMTGLESLKIKETDRVQAMMNELRKLGAELTENDGIWHLQPSKEIPQEIHIDTYKDHRMAMAFAPLSLIRRIHFDDPQVVEKSYPHFWEELKKLIDP